MSQSPITTVGFVSLGCPKNLVDSEQMLATLTDAGYEIVADHDEADAIIINTCGFLEASKTESVDVINEAVARKENGQVQRVVAAAQYKATSTAGVGGLRGAPPIRQAAC